MRNDPDTETLRDEERRRFLKMAGAVPVVAMGGAMGAALAGCASEERPVADDPSDLTASEAVRHIRDGSLSAEAYARRLLARYHAQKELNTVTWIDEQRLLEAARGVDQARARGETLGPLAGLPLILKDNIATVGFPTSSGTPGLKSFYPEANAPVAQILFANGAILFAKANMHELAGGGTSSNPTFGFVRNPYDPSRVPGGSSGGTAAAVAARIVPAGLGTDTAGSVRIPSAFCGVVGLRPSIDGPRKAYPDAGVVPMALALDTVGPIARTVSDVALLNAVVTGRSIPSVPGLAGIRIGIPQAPYWTDLDPEVSRVAKGALDRLRGAGAVLVDIDVSPYVAPANQIFGALIMSGIKEDLIPLLMRAEPGASAQEVVARIASRDTRALYDQARQLALPPGALAQARGEGRRRIIAAYEEIIRSNGLAAIAFPTEPIPAPPIRPQGDSPDDKLLLNGKEVSEALTIVRNTRITGALGVPGLTIPAGLTAAGLPVGLELDGPAGSDDRLLGIGMAAEAVLGRLPAPGSARV